MTIRGVAIGLYVMTAFSGAYAQDIAEPRRLAVVDASGRVVPLGTEDAAAPQRIGRPDQTSPCAGAKPLSADDARALISRIATEENFFPDFVMSVAKSESQFNSTALSDKGAYGLMQLEPETAQRFKVDLCDPAGNVLGGVRFLRVLHEKYRNPFFILAAYNAGELAVEKSRGVPPFPETVRFVAQVINDFYTWPAPGAQAKRDGRGLIADAPDLIEPAAPKPASPSHPAAPTAKAGWDNGFVMHID
ncbi:lytic transglycosylase domain-containing protein (plasmid) [Bradyrhizobium betae]